MLVIIGLVSLRYLFLDTKHEEFKTYSDLKKSSLIQKGWVPEFIPESSRNIEVGYNNDTNFVKIKLNLGNSDIATFVNKLKADGWSITQSTNLIEASKINQKLNGVRQDKKLVLNVLKTQYP
jgi:hypothetical protein